MKLHVSDVSSDQEFEGQQLNCSTAKDNYFLINLKQSLEFTIHHNKPIRDKMYAEMKLKNTLTADEYFPEMFIIHRGPEVSHAEVCEILDAQIVEWSYSKKSSIYDNSWRYKDLTHGDSVKVCNEEIPGLINHFKTLK